MQTKLSTITVRSLNILLYLSSLTRDAGIRALPNTASLAGFDNGLNSAILRYSGAPDQDPTTTQTPSVNPLLEQNLQVIIFDLIYLLDLSDRSFNE